MTPAEMLRAARALEKSIAAAWAAEAPDSGTTAESRALYAAMGAAGSLVRHIRELERLIWDRPGQALAGVDEEDPATTHRHGERVPVTG